MDLLWHAIHQRPASSVLTSCRERPDLSAQPSTLGAVQEWDLTTESFLCHVHHRRKWYPEPRCPYRHRQERVRMQRAEIAKGTSLVTSLLCWKQNVFRQITFHEKSFMREKIPGCRHGLNNFWCVTKTVKKWVSTPIWCTWKAGKFLYSTTHLQLCQRKGKTQDCPTVLNGKNENKRQNSEAATELELSSSKWLH